MAIEIKEGWLFGNRIRRARKAVSCNDFRHCQTTIKVGDYYAELECDPYYAGGFGMSKLCMGCAGEEARKSLADALATAKTRTDMCNCDKKADYACLTCRDAAVTMWRSGWDVQTVRRHYGEWVCDPAGVKGTPHVRSQSTSE